MAHSSCSRIGSVVQTLLALIHRLRKLEPVKNQRMSVKYIYIHHKPCMPKPVAREAAVCTPCHSVYLIKKINASDCKVFSKTFVGTVC